MTETTHPSRRWLALLGLAISIGLLMPGLIAPVITIRGNLEPEGLASLAPQLLEQGISDKTIDSLKPLLKPGILTMLGIDEKGLKKMIVDKIAGDAVTQLKTAPRIEVYQQTRSILSSVQHLYEVGSPTAATLILLFSVIVPLAKASLVMWALFHRDPALRRRTLHFVELIAKWSMADVFAVALFIAYLAAQASQTPAGPDVPPAIVTFTATFGTGFYWFAGYCLFSLGVQQATARWIMAAKADQPPPADPQRTTSPS